MISVPGEHDKDGQTSHFRATRGPSMGDMDRSDSLPAKTVETAISELSVSSAGDSEGPAVSLATPPSEAPAAGEATAASGAPTRSGAPPATRAGHSNSWQRVTSLDRRR